MSITTTSIGPRLRGLKHERAELEAATRARLEQAAAEGRDLTAGERAEDDAAFARLSTLNDEIARYQRMATPEPLPTAAQPRPRIVAGRRYVDMFGSHAIRNDGWRNEEEYLAALHSGLADPRLRLMPAAPELLGSSFQATLGTVSGGSVGGGFSVPTEFYARWLDDSLETEIVRPRCDVRPMTSDTGKAIGWDAANRSTTLYGGFSGQWTGPGVEITAEDPKLRLITLAANKLAILTQVSNELIADGLGFEQQLSSAITKAIGFFMDRAFLMGDGAGEPLGIVNAAATVVVSKEGGQAADTINYTNLTKMFARMTPDSMAKSIWIANPTTIPQLLALTVVVSSGGSHIPVLTESDGQFRILTRPVLFTEKLPVLGDKGDILFADLSQYVVGLRKDATLDKSQHVGFTRDTSYFRGILRADGQPKLNTTITPDNGDAMSPFVVLEAR